MNAQRMYSRSLAFQLMKCGACGFVKYCSKECQRADWPAHKPRCQFVPPLTSTPAPASATAHANVAAAAASTTTAASNSNVVAAAPSVQARAQPPPAGKPAVLLINLEKESNFDVTYRPFLAALNTVAVVTEVRYIMREQKLLLTTHRRQHNHVCVSVCSISLNAPFTCFFR